MWATGALLAGIALVAALFLWYHRTSHAVIPDLRGKPYSENFGGIPAGPSVVTVDVTINVLGRQASGTAPQDDGTWTVVAECNAGRRASSVHTVVIGVISNLDVTPEIVRAARAGSYHDTLSCGRYR